MRRLGFVLVVLLFACKPRSAGGDLESLIARLDDRDPKVRAQAAQQLRRLEAKQAAPRIAALLADPLVKQDAVLALQDLAGPGELDALLGALETTVGAGSDEATRSANRINALIAEALGNVGDPRAGPELLRLARATDVEVRLAAVEALGNIRSKEAVPELAHLVDDPAAPPLLIKRSIDALGRIGDPAAIPALARGLVIERQGVSFVPESSFALFVIGAPAVEPLIRTPPACSRTSCGCSPPAPWGACAPRRRRPPCKRWCLPPARSMRRRPPPRPRRSSGWATAPRRAS